MRGKSSVVSELSFKYLGHKVVLNLQDNHTFLGGESATGKSYLWKILRDIQSREEYSYIVTFNYSDINRDILGQLKSFTHKLIVIDNADILLDDNCREHIAFDFSNQYIIIGRNPRNLMLTPNNLATVEFNDNIFYIDYLSD